MCKMAGRSWVICPVVEVETKETMKKWHFIPAAAFYGYFNERYPFTLNKCGHYAPHLPIATILKGLELGTPPNTTFAAQ